MKKWLFAMVTAISLMLPMSAAASTLPSATTAHSTAVTEPRTTASAAAPASPSGSAVSLTSALAANNNTIYYSSHSYHSGFRSPSSRVSGSHYGSSYGSNYGSGYYGSGRSG